MESPVEVVIITGPPGAGKTSTARALADTFDRSVHLESDWFFRFIRKGFVAPHLAESHEQNTAVIDITADAAAGYTRAGNVVVWDGIVGPWFLARVVDRLAGAGVAAHYLVLRPDRATCLSRVAARDGTTDVSGAEVMWDQFADLDRYESHVVDASGTVDMVAERCRAALVDGDLVVG